MELDRKCKQEEEEAEEQERQCIEEAQCKAKEERERQKKHEKESVDKIAMSACADFIDIDEENEDNEHVEEPLAKPTDQLLLKQIKTEKEDGARDKQPSLESKTIQEQNELIKKIYNVNEQDYRIAVKNYDLNNEIEKSLNQSKNTDCPSRCCLCTGEPAEDRCNNAKTTRPNARSRNNIWCCVI